MYRHTIVLFCGLLFCFSANAARTAPNVSSTAEPSTPMQRALLKVPKPDLLTTPEVVAKPAPILDPEPEVVAKPAPILDEEPDVQDTVIKNNGASTETKAQTETEDEIRAKIAERTEYLNFIISETAALDEQMAQCESTKKKWKIATVLGGVGVATTGVAAVAQKVKFNKDIAEYEQKDTKE